MPIYLVAVGQQLQPQHYQQKNSVHKSYIYQNKRVGALRIAHLKKKWKMDCNNAQAKKNMKNEKKTRPSYMNK